MWELLEEAADQLIAERGLIRVDGVDTELPRMGTAWSVANSVGLIEMLRDHWPACADDLTPEIRFGMEHGIGAYDAEARIKLERRRAELNEAMARIFDTAAGGVDFVMTASNPDVAFAAEGPLPDTFGGIRAGAKINGRLTFPANLYGNPAISIPAGSVDGLPIGLQVVGPHFSEELLLDLALSVERNRPWPLTTPLPG
jgi:aspartyl-tRNA(Asn)/glutamyl-tRNA(Gln) amidotransferase subunit A